MDPNLTNKLIEIADKTQGSLAAAVDAMLKEAPNVVHDVLVWEAAHSFIYCLVLCIPLVVALRYIKAVWRWGKSEFEYSAGLSYIFCVFYTLLPIGVLLWINSELTWLQIIIAPRAFLLEYVQRLL